MSIPYQILGQITKWIDGLWHTEKEGGTVEVLTSLPLVKHYG